MSRFRGQLPNRRGKYSACLFGRDAVALREIINTNWNVDVGEYVIHQWLSRLALVEPHGGWSDATVLTWLRLRLLEAGPSVFKVDEDSPRIKTVLHVFPINYHESQEQVNRLKHGEPIPADPTPKPARSRLNRMQKSRVKPVDGLSARVSPGDWTPEDK